jgi:hypothetical protein
MTTKSQTNSEKNHSAANKRESFRQNDLMQNDFSFVPLAPFSGYFLNRG